MDQEKKKEKLPKEKEQEKTPRTQGEDFQAFSEPKRTEPGKKQGHSAKIRIHSKELRGKKTKKRDGPSEQIRRGKKEISALQKKGKETDRRRKIGGRKED